MSALIDLWHSVTGVFTSADMITLAIIVVIALAAGFMMESMGSLVTMTVGALVVFGLATYARAIAMGGGKDAGAVAQTDWHNLLGLQVQVLLAYAIAFAVVIAVVHLIRSLVWR
ncbi:MAG TPA: hypothetical protein VIM02_09585 [Rhizomicrobium sp.]|jgi:large-conductance mechanosensitive channel